MCPQVKPKLLHSRLLLLSTTTFFTDISIYAKSTIPRLSFGRYAPKPIPDSIHLAIESIIGPNFAVVQLLEVKIFRSGRSKLPPWGKIGTIAVQSLLLHIIFAQVWYETGQWRKIIRFSCKSWWFGGHLNTSWRSVLKFEQTTTLITNNIIKQHWHATTAREGYQKASFCIS